MKNRKILIIVLFIVLALPIPLSLISWIGTVISVANIGMMGWSSLGEIMQAFIALITMLLAGTYLSTYIFSVNRTWKEKELSSISFLPFLHIVLFIISMKIWTCFNDRGRISDTGIYKAGGAQNIVNDRETPLIRSIGCGIEKTKALVDAGVDINFRTEHIGMTAAIQALRDGGPNRTLEMLEYAHYLIVEKKADVTKPYLLASGEEVTPVNLLRNWVYPLGSDRHRLKMEIIEEFARQGVDYRSTKITKRQLDQIKKKYPDTWEEYIKRY